MPHDMQMVLPSGFTVPQCVHVTDIYSLSWRSGRDGPHRQAARLAAWRGAERHATAGAESRSHDVVMAVRAHDRPVRLVTSLLDQRVMDEMADVEDDEECQSRLIEQDDQLRHTVDLPRIRPPA